MFLGKSVKLALYVKIIIIKEIVDIYNLNWEGS
jgi:hypothetical protein